MGRRGEFKSHQGTEASLLETTTDLHQSGGWEREGATGGHGSADPSLLPPQNTQLLSETGSDSDSQCFL